MSRAPSQWSASRTDTCRRAVAIDILYSRSEIAFSYTVSNSGNVAVTNVSVTDTRISPITCQASTLAPATSTTCSGTTKTTAADITAKTITTNATARAIYNGSTITSPAAAATAGLNIDALRQAAKSATQSMVGQRASLVTSSGPESGRVHARLSGGSLFGGSDANPDNGPAPSAGFAAGGMARGSISIMPAGVPNASGFIGDISSTDRLDRLERARSGIGPDFGIGDAAPFGLKREAAGDDQARSFASNPMRLSGSMDNGMGQFGFATSLSQMRAAAETEHAQKLAAATTSGPTQGSLGLGSLGLSSGATSGKA